MSETARRYAAAYFGLDGDAARFAETARSIQDCAPLWEALTSPAVDRRDKERLLARLPQLRDTPQLLSFYRLLVRKGRTALLPQISDAMRAMALEAQNTGLCVLRCVHVPDEARQKAIRSVLCRLHHRSDVVLDIRQDPSLLGGMILEMDGVTYDRSIRGQLRRMAGCLEERSKL